MLLAQVLELNLFLLTNLVCLCWNLLNFVRFKGQVCTCMYLSRVFSSRRATIGSPALLEDRCSVFAFIYSFILKLQHGSIRVEGHGSENSKKGADLRQGSDLQPLQEGVFEVTDAPGAWRNIETLNICLSDVMFWLNAYCSNDIRIWMTEMDIAVLFPFVTLWQKQSKNHLCDVVVGF